MLLFDMLESRYEVVVTNLHLHAENIWRLYNRGAIVEQVIDEIKNDYCATRIRTNDFWANDALFQTGGAARSGRIPAVEPTLIMTPLPIARQWGTMAFVKWKIDLTLMSKTR